MLYRVLGREPDPQPVPAPPARAMLAPLGWGAFFVAALVVPAMAFDALVDPDARGGPHDVRVVPAVETARSATMLLLLASIVVVVVVLCRRVTPQWSGLGRVHRALYVVGLVVVQGVLVCGGEIALFQSRGGLRLFEPTLRASYAADGAAAGTGKTAYVYGGGLGCGYELFVADRFALRMQRVQYVAGHCGEARPPRVRWNGDGTALLVDDAGKPLEHGATPRLFGWGGGC